MQLEGAEWTLGERICKGGMGSTYDVISAGYGPAVARLVPKAPGAERESLFADLPGVRNVIPVIDRGDTGDYRVIVTPMTDMLPREHREEAGGQLGADRQARPASSGSVTSMDSDGRA
jgi:hypothetical protein